MSMVSPIKVDGAVAIVLFECIDNRLFFPDVTRPRKAHSILNDKLPNKGYFGEMCIAFPNQSKVPNFHDFFKKLWKITAVSCDK